MRPKDRKEIILTLIEKANGEIERLKLFKLGFLLRQEINDFYDFLPYKYGPYSFEMEKDIRFLLKNELIFENGKKLQLRRILPQSVNLVKNTKDKINEIFNRFGHLNASKILKYVYSTYPDLTLYSKLKVHNVKSKKVPDAINTIGYQDMSIDEFINILIKNKIETLIDVRNKPLSYKYGFSKFWLAKYLPDFGTDYIGIPNLGIPEIYRNKLSGALLWKKYNEILRSNTAWVNYAISLLKKKSSVLLCFEANPNNCHRSILAKTLSEMTKLKVIHLSGNNIV